MKRVVLVAPEFPPLNSAGAHRPRLLAKHLPAHGWTPAVITVRPERIEGPLDPMLERLVPPDLEVVRTGALPVRPLRIVGDLGLRSLAHHARALAARCRRGSVDAAVLFGPPWFSFLLGPLMRRWYGLPYVVDYIDPWLSGWSAEQRFPSKAWAYHRVAAALEPVVLRHAAHVTAVSSGILSDLQQRYPWLAAEKLSAMPYGADPDDLEAAAELRVAPPDFASADGSLTVSFTGAVQPRSGPLVRAVLAAVQVLRAEHPALGRRLRLRCYGTSNLTWGHGRYTVRPLAESMGLTAVVSEIPERIPYLQAMAVLQASDAVLVMGSWEHYYHASKLYPAIVAGRPILALCHRESSIARVMAETRAGLCICFEGPDDIDRSVPQIAHALVALLTNSNGGPPPAAIAPFTAHAAAGVLARALDGAGCGRGG